MRILLVRLGSLGDVVHGLPVAAALRAALPDAALDWLVDARYLPLLDLVPVLDGRIAVSPSAKGFLAAAASLRRRRYDVAFDLQGLWKSAVLARASGAPRVIGFSREHLREPGARLFYTEAGTAPSGGHVIAKNLSLLAALGIDAPPGAARFPIAVPESAVADAVRRRLGLGADASFAIVNPGAAWPNKRWPPERFGRLAAALAGRHGLRSAVTWGPGDEALAAAVAAASEGAAVVAPPTSIADLLVLSGAARLVVSGDTGPLHLAAALGTPVVALFGPTDAARNGPWAPDAVTVSRFEECGCRWRRRCTRPTPCLQEIGDEEVLRAVERRLASGPARG